MAREAQLVTGDAIQEAKYGLLFILNRSQGAWVDGCLRGLVEYASDPENWMTGGETTPDEAAQYFDKLFWSIKPVPFLIGMIADFPAVLDPLTGWLPCDGALYYDTDYPDLFDVIGVTYNQSGDPIDQFRVPDLRGRVRAGVDDGAGRLTDSWASIVSGAGGEDYHTLTTGEMPAHTHSEITAVSTLINGGLEAPAASATPSVGVTGSTGGGDPHNNVQPTMVFQPHIYARF